MSTAEDFALAQVDFARQQLGEKYVFGADGPNEWDCVHLVRKAARAAGLDGSVAPGWTNVRMLSEWAKANGLYRDASFTPPFGAIFLWGPADGSKPVKGAGHTGLVIEAPSAAKPNGWAISAYNPTRGVVEHRLKPKAQSGHALHGYVLLPYPTGHPEPPTIDPETTPPSGAIDPPPSAAQLQQRIDLAISALKGELE